MKKRGSNFVQGAKDIEHWKWNTARNAVFASKDWIITAVFFQNASEAAKSSPFMPS